jgi:cell wall-associated NlpC family hydrolase
VYKRQIQDYDQNIDHWVDPHSPQYTIPLLSTAQQATQMQILYQHEYASDTNGLSPWSAHYISNYLNQPTPNDLEGLEQNVIAKYGNPTHRNAPLIYKENNRPYTSKWIQGMIFNMNLAQLNSPIVYHAQNRAIATTNLIARSLPSFEPHFASPDTAGEGYPFDHLQVSAIWAGTPLYIIARTRDKAFDLVATSSFFGWVDSTGVAPADSTFIQAWQKAAHRHLAAILQNNTPIVDPHQHFLFSAYVGSDFPAAKITGHELTLMIPIQNAWHQARFMRVRVSDGQATLMPLSATPQHFAQVIRALQGIPYGWGNIYFYYDCSSLLKSTYLPFGIWLPRHSSTQVNSGVMVDLSALNPTQRLAYVSQHIVPFLSFVSLGDHVFMLLGNVPNPKMPGQSMVLTFQTLWGLGPADNKSRSIIGESVLLPLLLIYPEDPSLMSLLTAPVFQMATLS